MREKTSTKAPGRDDGDELKTCQVCSEPLVSGQFTPFLVWLICDDCVVEAALQVFAVFQKRMLSPMQTVVLGSDLKPAMIFDDEELAALRGVAELTQSLRDTEGREDGTVQSIR